MNVLDKYMKPQAEALSLRHKRLEILSSNIANAGTPNFKARDIDFAAQYKNAIGAVFYSSILRIDIQWQQLVVVFGGFGPRATRLILLPGAAIDRVHWP